MSEDKNPNNAEEEKKQEVTNHEKTNTAVESNDEEKNWRAFREERKKDREARIAAEKEAEERRKEAEALKSALDSALNKKEEKEYEENEDIEEKIKKAIEKRDQELEKKRKEQETKEMPVKLRKECPDFDNIVNEENLDYLEYKYPEVAQAYSSLPESFEKWKNIYRAVKRFVPSTQEDQKKLKENRHKPRSISSGLSQTGDEAPVLLDDKRKMDNWKRMQRIMKGVN